MVSELTRDDFHQHLDEAFRLELDEGSLQLELTEAECVGRPPGDARRQAFSLVFTGPQHPVLPQRLYRLVHPDMGALDIFLVPIGSGPGGTRYEAVFA